MTPDDPGPRSGWYVDPLGPLGRRRWWAEGAWTGRVAGPEEADGIAWRPDLADAPPPLVALPMSSAPATPSDSLTPIRWFAPGFEPPQPIRWFAPGFEPPQPAFLTVARSAPEPEAVDEQPEPIAAEPPLAPVLELPGPVATPRTITPRRRKVGAALVAAALLAIAAGAGGAIFGDGGRPEVAPVTIYGDADAGFALRYPNGWRVHSDTPGESIRFEIGPRDAPALLHNTVTVIIGPVPEATTLDVLAEDVTRGLREQFSGIRLESAQRAELAGGPAFRLELVDVNDTPPTRVTVVSGSTTDGRQLAVTVTIREPRTAPTPSELREFLDSITSL